MNRHALAEMVARAFCRNCDKDNVFCDKFCDKNGVRNFIGRDIAPVIRVEGKRMALPRSREICRD